MISAHANKMNFTHCGFRTVGVTTRFMGTGRTTRTGFGGLLSACLAVLLALQISSAFMPMPGAAGGEGLQIVICGGDGLSTITLDLTSGTADEDPEPQVTGKCPFCVAGVAAFLQQPDWAATTAEFHPFRYRIIATALTQPKWQHLSPAIRAPPLTV
jgi:hypothetical protein